MHARLLFTLALACSLLLPALSRAEYDWYNEKESSSSRPEPESDDGDGHADPAE